MSANWKVGIIRKVIVVFCLTCLLIYRQIAKPIGICKVVAGYQDSNSADHVTRALIFYYRDGFIVDPQDHNP